MKKGTWQCNVCGYEIDKEEEVTCWWCGKGEMVYQPYWIKRMDAFVDRHPFVIAIFGVFLASVVLVLLNYLMS